MICFYSFAQDEQTEKLPINVPEEGVTLGEEYPGNLGKPLYQDVFYDQEGNIISGDQENAVPPKHDEQKFETTGDAMAYGLKRGLANLTLFWLEIPRNLSYEFTARPLSAIATAPFLALGLGGARAIQGAIDIITLGYTGNYTYGAMPEFPWEGEWVAKETKHY